MVSLDPRAPLVIDTRDLGRRPGAMRAFDVLAPAPAGLGNDVIGVPQGAELAGRLQCESVVEGVWMSGTVHAPVRGECVRCLDPIDSERDFDLQEMFLYQEIHPDDVEAARLQDTLLDLEPTLRDAIVLALPLQPLCREDCPGLCPECGVRLADDPDHRHERTDPRWSALAELLNDEER